MADFESEAQESGKLEWVVPELEEIPMSGTAGGSGTLGEEVPGDPNDPGHPLS